MGGNKKPRKKKTLKNTKAEHEDQVKNTQHGRTLMYIIGVMSVIGAGLIIYFVS